MQSFQSFQTAYWCRLEFEGTELCMDFIAMYRWSYGVIVFIVYGLYTDIWAIIWGYMFIRLWLCMDYIGGYTGL